MVKSTEKPAPTRSVSKPDTANCTLNNATVNWPVELLCEAHTHPKISCLTSNLQNPKVNDPMNCLNVHVIKSHFFTGKPETLPCEVRGYRSRTPHTLPSRWLMQAPFSQNVRLCLFNNWPFTGYYWTHNSTFVQFLISGVKINTYGNDGRGDVQ